MSRHDLAHLERPVERLQPIRSGAPWTRPQLFLAMLAVAVTALWLTDRSAHAGCGDHVRHATLASARMNESHNPRTPFASWPSSREYPRPQCHGASCDRSLPSWPSEPPRIRLARDLSWTLFEQTSPVNHAEPRWRPDPGRPLGPSDGHPLLLERPPILVPAI